MQFSVFALTLRNWNTPPPLREVWAIDDAELAAISAQALSHFNSEPLASIHETIRWQSLAIQEFADLQDLTFPKAGRHFNINFFFFEGLSALREGILAGINSGVHASLATLRAVFEMFALHCYWKQKRLEEDTYDEFYRWFGGTGKAPGFGKLLALCYAPTPPGATTATSAQALYARLCSYVHKPAISESITSIKSGNRPGMSSELARYWAQIVIELQQHVVELLVRASPTALFPIDITRKFGFNPPFGVFFDQDSFRVLQKAIGKELILSYRNAYLKDGEPLSEIRWALDRPNLTDAKIFKSWRDAQTPQLEGKTKAERMNRGRLLLKAKTRVIGQSMAYMLDTPEMPDIRELIATLKSTGQG